ncbi:MAG TPA: L,D-transpeptidase family protein [Myxococcota bacterium]|nr:L,D-transpeptidase family protein [Myxococcota bacterium]
MTARRSKFARGAALALLVASACARAPGPTRYLLENPPASPDLVGKLSFHETSAEDTLVDLAPELRVGYVELLAANPGVDPWLPGETQLTVPAARLLPSGKREGIVVNTGDLHLYWFAKDAPPRAYPIGIAKDGYATPLGVTTVKAKKEKPTWMPGESAHRDDPTLANAIPPGPTNPLGEYALYLGWPSYLIHGTNEPRGVGRHSSRGCIRLYPDDIAELYASVPLGTPVRVVNEPVKLGWIGGELYLEVNPDPDQSLELDENGKLAAMRKVVGLRELVTRAAGKQAKRVDWALVERAGQKRIGVPTRITIPARAASGG